MDHVYTEPVLVSDEETKDVSSKSSEHPDQLQENAVYIYRQGNENIKCPKCGKSQISNRDSCYQCGVKFVTTYDESRHGLNANVQSNGIYSKNEFGKATGSGTSSLKIEYSSRNEVVPVPTSTTIVRSESFVMTKKIARVMEIDENHKMVKFIAHGVSVWFGKEEKERIYKYKDIIGYELIENNGSVTKGGFGGAVAGGLLFGGFGAVTGSVLGKKNHSLCNNMSVRITVTHLQCH